MRMILRILIFGSLFNPVLALSQLSFPIEDFYHGEIDRIYVHDSTSTDYYFNHLSSKPISYSRTNAEHIFTDSSKQYYWITQKLFKENFLIFKGDNFWCSVDPLIDLEMGHDLKIDSMHYKLWNTRGIRVQAQFLNKVSFVTTFYETQASLPDYQRAFFQSRGEFIPSGGVTIYNQKNAVVPGYARTKNFKTNGYDFAFAEGYLTIAPNRFFNLHFGNGSHFIGNGYRSLLLSDNATNYPFLKLETNLWNGRIQYHVMYAVMTNLYRLKYYETTEATYERKLGAFHFLDVAITPKLNIGIFEGSVWKHTDSLGTSKPDPLFANPLILSNSLIKGESDSIYNSILGLNLSYSFLNSVFYGQLVVDHGKIAAYQAGIKSYDVLIPKLDLQAEYNHAEQNTYLSHNKRYNYSHYNLSLGHPLSGAYDELVFRINYQYKRWFIQNHTTYSARYENDSLNFGNDIIAPFSDIAIQFYDRKKVFYNQFEVGYRFNKRYNFQTYLGYLYRNDNTQLTGSVTQFIYFGVRTRLRNKRFDY